MKAKPGGLTVLHNVAQYAQGAAAGTRFDVPDGTDIRGGAVIDRLVSLEGGAPSVDVATIAGTINGIPTVNGTDLAGELAFVTKAGAPAANTLLFHVTFAVAFDVNAIVLLTERSNNGGVAKTWIAGADQNGFNVINGSGALVGGTTYKLGYIVAGQRV